MDGDSLQLLKAIEHIGTYGGHLVGDDQVGKLFAIYVETQVLVRVKGTAGHINTAPSGKVGNVHLLQCAQRTKGLLFNLLNRRGDGHLLQSRIAESGTSNLL